MLAHTRLCSPAAATANLPVNRCACRWMSLHFMTVAGSCSRAPEWCSSISLGCVSLCAGSRNHVSLSEGPLPVHAGGPTSLAAAEQHFARLLASAKQASPAPGKVELSAVCDMSATCIWCNHSEPAVVSQQPWSTLLAHVTWVETCHCAGTTEGRNNDVPGPD